MSREARKSSKFLNSREWCTFLATTQTAVAGCPSFKGAMRASREWLDAGAQRARGWLADEPEAPLGAVAQKPLGI